MALKTIKWSEMKHKSSPDRITERKAEARAELERLGFGKLREAQRMTQVAVADKLNITQATLSRMEKRSDLLLSTLREYIGALGGRLVLRADFPEGSFEVEPLSTPADPVSPKTRARRPSSSRPTRSKVAAAAPRRRRVA